MNFFSLPQSIRVSLCLEWTHLNDLVQFDSAVTEKSHRQVYLSDVAEKYAVNNKGETDFTKSFVSWIMSRKIYVSRLTFEGNNFFETFMKSYLKSNLVDKVTSFSLCNSTKSIDSIASFLDGLPALEEIHLTSSEYVTNKVITNILKMNNLSSISVMNLSGANTISTDTFKKIAKECPQLHDVTFSGKNVNDSVIKALTKDVPNLKRINVSGVENLDSNCLIELFKSHPHMEAVDISFCSLTNPELFNTLARNCKDLKEFKIEQYGDQYGDAAEMDDFVELLTECKKLTHLNLGHQHSWDNSTDSMKALIENIHNLREIKLDYHADSIPSEIFEEVILANPKLEKVSIRHVSCIDDTSVKAIANCPLLEELVMAYGRAGGNSIALLAEKCGNSVRVLDLNAVHVGDVGCIAIAKHCPNLREINLLYTGAGPKGVEALGVQCKKLRLMRVFKGSGTDKLFKKLKKLNPLLEITHKNNDHDDSTGGGEDEELEDDEFGEDEDGDEDDDDEEGDDNEGDGDEEDDDESGKKPDDKLKVSQMSIDEEMDSYWSRCGKN